MREIKFRVWDGINITNLDREQEEFQIIFGMQDEWVIWSPEEQLNSENYELMQYTGLKDSCDREIYEGDIYANPNGRRFKIVFDGQTASFVGELIPDNIAEKLISVNGRLKGVVIGNIYENTEQD